MAQHIKDRLASLTPAERDGSPWVSTLKDEFEHGTGYGAYICVVITNGGNMDAQQYVNALSPVQKPMAIAQIAYQLIHGKQQPA